MNSATNLSVQRLGDLMNSLFEKNIVMLTPLIPQNFMQWKGSVNNILVPADRIMAGCNQMGMSAGCGGAR
jgi:hypothetical protein